MKLTCQHTQIENDVMLSRVQYSVKTLNDNASDGKSV